MFNDLGNVCSVRFLASHSLQRNSFLRPDARLARIFNTSGRVASFTGGGHRTVLSLENETCGEGGGELPVSEQIEFSPSFRLKRVKGHRTVFAHGSLEEQ